MHLGENPVLIDPLVKILEIFAIQDIMVDDLIQTLQPTEGEVQLIQGMSVGQCNDPLWFEAWQ